MSSEPEPITPEMIAAADQACKAAIDLLPPLWWGLYQECKQQGFTNYEALELVKTWIMKL